jgi:hypothetical protein
MLSTYLDELEDTALDDAIAVGAMFELRILLYQVSDLIEDVERHIVW